MSKRVVFFVLVNSAREEILTFLPVEVMDFHREIILCSAMRIRLQIALSATHKAFEVGQVIESLKLVASLCKMRLHYMAFVSLHTLTLLVELYYCNGIVYTFICVCVYTDRLYWWLRP